jgi:hypothetical protein
MARAMTRPPLLAVVVDDVGELALAAPVHHVGGALALLFHAHVERAVGAEGEAALGPVELHGGHADVQGDAVGGVDAACVQQRAMSPKRPVTRLRRPL